MKSFVQEHWHFLWKAALGLFFIAFGCGNPAVAEEGSFKVHVGIEGQTPKAMSCETIVGRTHRYSTKTTTTNKLGMWACEGASCGRNEWSLAYKRTGKQAAEAGRCSTSVSKLVSGNGRFSARIYLHKSIQRSSGVYTIAILPDPFDKKEELDLVVINLSDNRVNFGTPSRSTSIEMDRIIDKWLTVSMRKRGKKCRLTIKPEKGDIIDLGTIYCNTNNKSNKIVVNARARDSRKNEKGVLTISSVSWIKDKKQPIKLKSSSAKN